MLDDDFFSSKDKTDNYTRIYEKQIVIYLFGNGILYQKVKSTFVSNSFFHQLFFV